jgi:hypothetical protein
MGLRELEDAYVDCQLERDGNYSETTRLRLMILRLRDEIRSLLESEWSGLVDDEWIEEKADSLVKGDMTEDLSFHDLAL